jgi:hypothetical protein
MGGKRAPPQWQPGGGARWLALFTSSKVFLCHWYCGRQHTALFDLTFTMLGDLLLSTLCLPNGILLLFALGLLWQKRVSGLPFHYAIIAQDRSLAYFSRLWPIFLLAHRLFDIASTFLSVFWHNIPHSSCVHPKW